VNLPGAAIKNPQEGEKKAEFHCVPDIYCGCDVGKVTIQVPQGISADRLH
jgi:hypothetical protein